MNLDDAAKLIVELEALDVANESFANLNIKIFGYEPPADREIGDFGIVKIKDPEWGRKISDLWIRFKFMSRDDFKFLNDLLKEHGMSLKFIRYSVQYISP